MSTTTPKSRYLDVLKDIEDFYTENAVEVWCPTSGISLKFKPLSVSQLKKFIELQVAAEKDEFGVLPGLRVVKKLNDVLADNCLEKSADIFESVTILDRDAVIVQLRANVKSEADVVVDGETEVVDLHEVVKKIKKVKFDKKLRSRTKSYKFGESTLKLNLRLPSLNVDNTLNGYFANKVRPKLQKGKKHVEKDVEKILSQVFFIEMSKYIESVVVSKDTTETVISFDQASTLDDSLAFLEKLPSKLLSEVSGYATDIKAYRDSTISYTSSEDKDIPLDIDVALFAGI